MNNTQKTFFRPTKISRTAIIAGLVAICGVADYSYGAVVSRTSVSARPTVSATRTNTSGRMPTTVTTPSQNTTQSDTTETNADTPLETDDTTTTDRIEIENKSAEFDELLSYSSTSATDTSAQTLAELVAAQRAELDAQSAITTANAVLTGNQNACDMGLRACMREKCGTDFTNCSGDTDTAWGNKMDSCRNSIDATCTGEEYRLFAAEIKSDRDINAQLASYNAVLNCGNQYNDCIVTECGTTFGGCLGKSAGDAAIAKCKTIADNCIQQDSGLASRAMQVFANLRVDAEEQIQRDEQRLYELRDDMIAQCQTLGATFDERTFTCVYTVEFYAGDDTTLFASKKLYAGGTFDCTPNWFGIDVTTFMENAYRLTRAQSSASSALLGSGLGVAAGAITSGAIDRAIDRQKADKALKDAQEEYDENYTPQEIDEKQVDTRKSEKTIERNAKKTSDATDKQMDAETEAELAAITTEVENMTVEVPDIPDATTPLLISEQKQRCKIVGSWINGKCFCDNGGTFNNVTGMCECGANQKYNSETKKCEWNSQIDLTSGLTGNNTGGGLLGGTNSGIGNMLGTGTSGGTLGTRTLSTRSVLSSR